MKKKLALVMASVLLVAAVSGCGGKTNTANNQSKSGETQQDVSEKYGTQDYTPDQVNMGKVGGTKLKSSTDKKQYSGNLGKVEVTIDEARVIEYGGADVAVISYKMKNNGDQDASFTGKTRVGATQNGDRLQSLVVTGVEGVTMLAMSENIKKGETITVQTAYVLRDKTSPVVVDVTEFDMANAETNGLSKTFEF